jgi:hypothetical protein
MREAFASIIRICHATVRSDHGDNIAQFEGSTVMVAIPRNVNTITRLSEVEAAKILFRFNAPTGGNIE